jgi:hypothetical protein
MKTYSFTNTYYKTPKGKPIKKTYTYTEEQISKYRDELYQELLKMGESKALAWDEAYKIDIDAMPEIMAFNTPHDYADLIML